jgi:hypothetical protein
VTALDGGFNVGYSCAEGDISYTLELGVAPGMVSKTIADIQVKGSCRVEGLKNGQPVYFRMKRRMKGGESGWSEECKVTPEAPAAPPTPVLQGVVRGPEMASLSFEPAPGATEYVIRYQAAGGEEIRKEIHAAQIGQCTISGLEDGKAYTFAIAARNAQGTSAFSEAVTVK